MTEKEGTARTDKAKIVEEVYKPTTKVGKNLKETMIKILNMKGEKS